MADSPGALPAEPLTRADLVAALQGGEKPKSAWRIGAEHEKFLVRDGDQARPAYAGKGGVEALLRGFERFGWRGVHEAGADAPVLIGLERRGELGLENISLEPGGQFELSGAPLPDIHASAAELQRHLDEAHAVGGELGLSYLGLGFDPLHTRAQVPVMPKGRYAIMRAYMPKVGGLGLDMMLRTCTVQANLDFSSEADMVRKFRTSLALQPLATALFANSPFIEGSASGWLSSRARVWIDTDADRTGLLGFVFEEGFGYERYVDYALDVPMYFVKRDGRYVDLSGRSFRRFMEDGLPELPGERPSAQDWGDHLTTAFPEVRLKSYLEMRGADCGSQAMLNALPALWTGLLYDDAALAAAWDVAKDWTHDDREALRLDAARVGLKAQVAGRPLAEVAREVLAIARAGLAARGKADGANADECAFLDPLDEIAASGLTQADRWLAGFEGAWSGDVHPIYAAARL